MDVGDNFSISPNPLKGLHKYSLNIYELFWDVKMEICIFEKKQNQHLQKCKSIYTTATSLSDEECVNFVRPKEIVIKKTRKKTAQKIETVKY